MGIFLYIIKKIFKISVYLAVLASLITFIPNLPPYTKFSSISLELTKDKTGPLSVNSALNNVQKINKNDLLGPETFQLWKNELYTSLATGEIVKVSPGGHVTFVTKIGKPCTGLTQEHICGRPLGFVIDEKNNAMYLADSYLGIWRVDLQSDKKQLLVSPQVPIDGKVPKFFNSVVLDNNNGLYWTESTTDYDLKDGIFTGLTDPAGRLHYYNLSTKENKVLMDKVWFPNGIVISPDNSFIVFSESLKYRLLKYYINGPKKGTTELFTVGIPGLPDNLRVLPDGSGIQVALYTVFDENNPFLSKSLAGCPLVRKFLARLLRLIEIPFEFLNSQFPNPMLEEIIYKVGHFSTVSTLSSGESGLVLVDWSGNIFAAYYNTDNSVNAISDAIVFNDKLVLGAPHVQNFIGAVPIPEQLKKNYIPKNARDDIKPAAKSDDIKPKQTNPSENKVKDNKKVEEKKIETQKTKETTTPKPVVRNEKHAKVETVKPPPQVTTTVKPKMEQTKPVDAKPTPKVIKEPQPVLPKDDNSNIVKEKVKVNIKTEQQNSPNIQKNNKENDKDKKSETVKINKSPEKPAPSSNTKNDNINKVNNDKPQSNQNSKPIPKDIPIKEEIISDTAKPNKEKLKVIKKSGPEEIPNPKL